MAIQFQTISESDLGGGIDQQSAENKVQPGHLEDLVNMDPQANGQLSRRKGSQSLLGELPLRIQNVKQLATGKIQLTFTGGVDFSQVASNPVLIRGAASVPEFGAGQDRWYPGFTADARRYAPANQTTVFQFSASEHGQPFGALIPVLVTVFSSDSPSNNNNTIVYPNRVDLDTNTGILSVEIVNESDNDLPLFFAFRSGQEPGKTFLSTNLTIPSNVHGLASTNLGYRIFEQGINSLKEIVPNQVIIGALGDVQIDLGFPPEPGSTGPNHLVCLVSNPLANTAGGQVPAESVHQIELVTGTNSFNEVTVALNNGDGSKEIVIPDSISYDVSTGLTTVGFQNEGPARSFSCFWENRDLALNIIEVDAATSTLVDISDSNPQLVMHGVSHSVIYQEGAGTRAGWVHHLDSYRSTGEQFLVAGIGGNFFRDSQQVSYLGYPSLRTRANQAVEIGPAISDAPTSRTRGNLVTDAGGTGWLTADQVTFDINTGYTLVRCPVGTYSFDAGAIESGDKLIVEGGSYSKHNGSFIIGQIDLEPDTVTFHISNPNMNSDWNDTGCAARVGVFSDTLQVEPSQLDAGDVLTSDAVTGLTVIANGAGILRVDGVFDAESIPAGLLLLGKRNTNVLALRDALGIPSVVGLVPGDMLDISGELIKTKILEVDTGSNTVTVDRSILIEDSFANSQVITVSGRWSLIGTPDAALSTTGLSPLEHPITSSTMAGDNLYLTDGISPVKKMTGESVLDAGLPRWQLQAFLIPDEAPVAAPLGLIDVEPEQTNTYRYYYRLNTIDANDNLIASAVVGSNETFVELTRPAQIRHKLIGLPSSLGSLDTSRIEVEIYRTMANLVTPFYKVATIPTNGQEWVEFVDAVPDSSLNENDAIAVNFTGAELPTAITDPLIAKHMTSLGNRTVFANLRGRPKIDLSFRGSSSSLLSVSQFDAMDFLIRKSNLDNGTVNSPEERIALRTTTDSQPVSIGNEAGLLEISGLTQMPNPGDLVYLFSRKKQDLKVSHTDIDTATDIITAVGHGLQDGQQVFLDTQPNGMSPQLKVRVPGVQATAYTVQVLSPDTFKLNGIDLLNAGTGTLTIVSQPGINLRYQGWHPVAAITGPDSVQLGVPFSGSGPADVDSVCVEPGQVPVYLGTDDLGFQTRNGLEPNAVNVADWVLSRVSKAIQRTAHLATKAWVTANAGSDIEGPVLRLEFRNLVNTAPETLVPDLTGRNLNVFGNGILRESDDSVGAKTNLYPSRLVFSYPNFPDILDDPEVETDNQSPNVIDINANDGQEITKVLPFFGISASGGSQKNTILVVFKTNSIYLVDLSEKAAGRNPVQKIDSRGMGLDIEGSAAPTKDGILFLNTSGAFRLTESLQLEYTGQRIERLYKQLGTNTQVLAFGHHSSLDQQWKCSILLPEETQPDTALVYCHTRETAGNSQGRAQMGAWTRYTGQNAIGWANLDSNEFRATTKGDVALTLRTGTRIDHSDSGEAFLSKALLGAKDFGDGGIRKLIGGCVVKYRETGDMFGTIVKSAPDLSSRFKELDAYALDTREQTDNLSDQNDKNKVNTVRYSVPDRKCVYLQLSIENGNLNESLEITEVSYRVAGLTDKGIGQAKKR